MMPGVDVPAVLLLHHHPPLPGPPDQMEGVRAFGRSRYPVVQLNTALGVPAALTGLRFAAVVLHYSVFYAELAPILPFREALAAQRAACTVALLQDEQASIAARVGLLGELGADALFTCLEPDAARRLYGGLGARLHTVIPGYVSDRLVAAAARLALPDARRARDVGYRGRRPPAAWGPEAAEKWQIAERFLAHPAAAELVVDVSCDEADRIYGERWWAFLGASRATLGAESGTTIPAQEATGGAAIPYRTISPRHLEAAALGTCQLLLEGRYSGLMEPDVHYLAVRKDYANLDDAVAQLRHPARRAEVARRARADLVDSGALAYDRLIARIDAELAEALGPPRSVDLDRVRGRLYGSRARRRLRRAVARARIEIGDRVSARRAAR